MSAKRTLDKAIKACDSSAPKFNEFFKEWVLEATANNLEDRKKKYEKLGKFQGGYSKNTFQARVPNDKIEEFKKLNQKYSLGFNVQGIKVPKKEKMVPVEKGIIIRKSNESALKSILDKFGLKLIKDKRTEERANLWNTYDKSVYEAVLIKGKIPESKQDDLWYGDFPRYIAQEIW